MPASSGHLELVSVISDAAVDDAISRIATKPLSFVDAMKNVLCRRKGYRPPRWHHLYVYNSTMYQRMMVMENPAMDVFGRPR